MQGQLRTQKINEGFRKRQLASSSKLYPEGEFVKMHAEDCRNRVPQQASVNISLMRNSLANRIVDLVGDLEPNKAQS